MDVYICSTGCIHKLFSAMYRDRQNVVLYTRFSKLFSINIQYCVYCINNLVHGCTVHSTDRQATYSCIQYSPRCTGCTENTVLSVQFSPLCSGCTLTVCTVGGRFFQTVQCTYLVYCAVCKHCATQQVLLVVGCNLQRVKCRPANPQPPFQSQTG